MSNGDPGVDSGASGPEGSALGQGSARAEDKGRAFDSGTPGRPGVGAEASAVALAVGVWVGAGVAHPVLPVGAVAVPLLVVAAGLALIGRRPWLLIGAATLLAGHLGHRAEQAFVPVAAGQHQGPVVVVDEAEPLGRGWRAPVRLADGSRVQAIAFGPVGHRLARLGAGTTVTVEGRLEPLEPTGWTRSRHLRGELAIADLERPRPPSGLRGAVEAVRRRTLAGAEPLPRHQQAIYTGLVVGEDRLQAPAQRARFRAAGLSHLLAVSGQNVAFVLAVVAVPAAVVPRRVRLGLFLAVLAAFAVATRLEPSVLRATAMAALSTWATLTGRDAVGLAPLAVAVAGLILIDPFLVWSVGFRLSVVASAAIVVLAPALARRLPGPELVRRPLAVTLAAQIGVAPLLVHHFDRVPLASVPANLAAGGAAGTVMVWGLTVGPVAGALPSPIGGWLQSPVSGLLWWLDATAAWAVRLPLPVLDGRGLVAMAALVLLGWVAVGQAARALGPRAGAIAGVALLVLALLAAAATPLVARPPAEVTRLEGGGHWYPGPDGGAVLVAVDADRRLLDAVLAHRIDRIDVVVAQRGSGPPGDIAVAVADLARTGRLLAPGQHRLPGAYRVTQELTLATGAHRLQVTPVGNELVVGEVPP
ncbi:MAG: ComEC/Rec2 family competence protein [Actinomycetota bacterium]